MKAELISTTGERKLIVPTNGSDFSLEELYTVLGCKMIEVVPVGQRILIADEEGLLVAKQLNRTASMIAGMAIVGDVVLCDDEMLR